MKDKGIPNNISYPPFPGGFFMGPAMRRLAGKG